MSEEDDFQVKQVSGGDVQEDFEAFLKERKIDIASLKGTSQERLYDAEEARYKAILRHVSATPSPLPLLPSPTP